MLYCDFETILVPPDKDKPPDDIDVDHVDHVDDDVVDDDDHDDYDDHELEPGLSYVSWDDVNTSSSNTSTQTSSQNILNHHRISAFSIYCQAPPQLQHHFAPIGYTGSDSGAKFIQELLNIRSKIRELYETECRKPMQPLTHKEQNMFDSVNVCHICELDITCPLTLDEWVDTMASRCFTDDEYNTDGKCFTQDTDLLGPKVRYTCMLCVFVYCLYFTFLHRDHCHISSKFRGPAHAKCNIAYHPDRIKVPAYFHNGGGYDFNILIDLLTSYPEQIR